MCCLACKGHLEVVYHIFVYLKKYENLRIVLNDAEPVIDDHKFVEAYWKAFYGDMKVHYAHTCECKRI